MRILRRHGQPSPTQRAYSTLLPCCYICSHSRTSPSSARCIRRRHVTSVVTRGFNTKPAPQRRPLIPRNGLEAGAPSQRAEGFSACVPWPLPSVLFLTPPSSLSLQIGGLIPPFAPVAAYSALILMRPTRCQFRELLRTIDPSASAFTSLL